MVHEKWLRRQMADPKAPVVDALIDGIRAVALK
jgi:hypothetical protein